MSRGAVLAGVLIVGCGASRAVAPAAEGSPAPELDPPPEQAASSSSEGGTAEQPDSGGASAWLAALARAETAADPDGREVRCVEVAPDAAPVHVASCERTVRNAYAPTAVYVGRRGPAAVTTIGNTRLDGALREIRVSARSATAFALALRPRELSGPGVELVCSSAVGRCAVLPVESEPESDEPQAELAVALEDTVDGTVVRVDGASLPGSLGTLRNGTPLAALFVEGDPTPLAAPLDAEAELARLFRVLQPTAAARVRELVPVDDGNRHETLTLTEPSDQLLRAVLLGPMSDVYEAQLYLQLLEAPASGLAVLTSGACFTSPSSPARGGRWPARALRSAVPFGDEHADILEDAPSSLQDLPSEPEGWQVQQGTVCHGSLCSGVTLLGEPTFLATMRAILGQTLFGPATVSITARRECEGP